MFNVCQCLFLLGKEQPPRPNGRRSLLSGGAKLNLMVVIRAERIQRQLFICYCKIFLESRKVISYLECDIQGTIL